MSEEKNVDRRGYVKYAGAGVVVIAVAGAGAYYATRPGPTTVPPTTVPETTTVAPTTVAPTTETPKEDLKVAYFLNGHGNDLSWNQAHFEGAKMVEKEGLPLEMDIVEGVGFEEAPRVMRQFIEEGWNFMVPTTTFAVQELIKEYKDKNVYFLVQQGSLDDVALNPGKTCISISTDHEAWYLLGIMAAKMSKTGVVAVISGFEVWSTNTPSWAFHDGYKSILPEGKVLYSVAGDWENPGKGKELALSVISAGADIILNIGDGTAMGILEGAKEKNILQMSEYWSTKEIAPKTTIASVKWHWGRIYSEMCKDIINTGKLKPQYDMGFLLGDIEIEYNMDLVSQKIIDEASAYKDKIESGEIKVTRNASDPSKDMEAWEK